jgi:hypothetical protein
MRIGRRDALALSQLDRLVPIKIANLGTSGAGNHDACGIVSADSGLSLANDQRARFSFLSPRRGQQPARLAPSGIPPLAQITAQSTGWQASALFFSLCRQEMVRSLFNWLFCIRCPFRKPEAYATIKSTARSRRWNQVWELRSPASPPLSPRRSTAAGSGGRAARREGGAIGDGASSGRQTWIHRHGAGWGSRKCATSKLARRASEATASTSQPCDQ